MVFNVDDVLVDFLVIRGKKADGVFCVYRLEFERQQREELEKLELKRYES